METTGARRVCFHCLLSLSLLYANPPFPGNNLYGCLKQMYKIKLANRTIKVMLSVGGWTYSQDGHFAFVTNAAARTQFVNDAVQLIEDYGFDGIDLDFEYPGSAEQGAGFGALFTELRAALDKLQQRKGDATPYEISVAVSAGPDNYKYLDVNTMDKALTYWNLMVGLSFSLHSGR